MLLTFLNPSNSAPNQAAALRLQSTHRADRTAELWVARLHSQIIRSSHLIVLVMILGAAGCSRAPVVILTNRSTNALANVVVSGSGFSNRINSIAAGAETRFTVRPRGESGIRIAFDAGGQHIDSGEQGYFEASGGYRISVTVGPDLNVSVSLDLRKR